MKKLLLLICLVLVLVVSSAVFLFTTESGLRLGVQLASTLSGGAFQVERMSGNIFSGFSFEKVSVTTEQASVSVFEARLDWNPAELQEKKLFIGELYLQGMDVRLKKQRENDISTGDAALTELKELALPLAVIADDVVLNNITVWEESGEQLLALDSLSFGLRLEQDTVALKQFQLKAPGLNGVVDGRLDASGEGVVELDGTVELDQDAIPPVSGAFQLEGTLQELAAVISVTGPAAVDVDLSVSELLSNPAWQTTFSVSDFDLSFISEEITGVVTTISGSASGTFEKASASISGELAVPDYGEVTFQIAVEGSEEQIRIEQGEFATALGQVELSQVVVQLVDGIDWQGRVNITDLDPGYLDSRYKADIDAELWTSGRYNGGDDLEASVDLVQLQAAVHDRTLIGSGNVRMADNVLELKELLFTSDTSSLQLSGAARFAQGQSLFMLPASWELETELSDFDPSVLLPEYPGLLNGSGFAEGRVDDGDIRFNAYIENLSGTLRDYLIHGKGIFGYDRGILNLNDIRFSSGESQLKANGSAGEKLDLSVAVTSPDLGQILAGAEGVFHLDGVVTGSRELPEFDLAFGIDDFFYQDVAVNRLSGQLSGSPAFDRPLTVKVEGDGFDIVGERIGKVEFSLDGTGGDHQFSLDLQTADLGSFLIKGRGRADESMQWSTTLFQSAMTASWVGDWQQEGKGNLNVSSENVVLEDLCFQAGKESFCLGGGWSSDGVWESDLVWKGISLTRLDAFDWLDEGFHGQTHGNVTVRGDYEKVEFGMSHLEVSDFSIGEDGINGDWELLDARNLVLDATLVEEKLRANLGVTMEDRNQLAALFEVDDVGRFDHDYNRSALTGSADLTVDNLGFVAPLTNYYVYPAGILHGVLQFSGNLLDPHVSGKLVLSPGSIGFPTFGSELVDVRFKVEGEGTTLWLWGEGSSGPGRLYADGTLKFKVDDVLGEFNFTGEDIDTFGLSDYVIRTTPDLRLVFNSDKGALFGELAVPYALLTPETMSNSISESDDIVFTDSPEEAVEHDWIFKTILDVRLGDDVTINAQGLNGKLTGGIQVQSMFGSFVTGLGELALENGTFSVYGRTMDIVRGRVFFGGGPIDDPGIDVRAQKVVADQEAGPNGVKVGVDVSGTAEDLEFSLFSEPYMDESDILAYMVIGRSMSNSGDGDENILNAAAMALGVNSGTQLIRGLTSILPVDDVYFEGETSGERLSLVVGKKLTDELFIGYDHNFFDQRGEVTIRYELGRGFYVESRTSAEATGADLLFSFER